MILASNFGHNQGTHISTTDERFRLLWVPAYKDNGSARIAGWLTFAAQAFCTGLRTPCDVVFGSSPQILAPAAALGVAKLRHKPFVLEIRDLWPESIVTAGELKAGSAVHRVLVTLESWLYRNASRIVVVTKGWEDHIGALGGNVDHIVVVPNGTDLDDFRVDQTKEELREQYGITGWTAVFSGGHGPYVGLPLILEAAEQLPDVNFLLVGSGTQKQWAIDEAKTKGLTNVEFRDPVPKAELPRILRACDAGIHSIAPQSVFDKGMSPNKLFDYMAAGLPVVTNAKIPLSDVISDDQVGAVVDPPNLAEGIRRVLEADEQTRQRWQDFATNLLRTRFSRQAAADTLAQAFEESLQETGKPSLVRRAAPLAVGALGAVALLARRRNR